MVQVDMVNEKTGRTWKETKTRKKTQHAFIDKTDSPPHLMVMWTFVANHPRPVIQTSQGMWYRIKQACERNGWQFKMHDVRIPFPQPRLDLMNGFRFSQEALLREALLKNASGIIEAPTRWGKTHLIKNILKAYSGMPILVTAPGLDLLKQLQEQLTQLLPGREIKSMIDDKTRYQGDDITIISMDSLHKADKGRTMLIVIDEPHALVTDGRMPEFLEFTKARKLAVGATPGGRFDNRDILIEGVIGPVLARRTFREAVEEGAICQIVVFMIDISCRTITKRKRRTILKEALFESPAVAEVMRRILTWLPEDWQKMAFIKNEDSARFFQGQFPGSEIAMAKLLTKTQREDMRQRMAEGSIKLAFASDIYAQGLTFSDLMVLFNLGSGGPYVNAVQKPGRLAEIRPGKKAGYMFDFRFVPEAGATGSTYPSELWGVIKEGEARREVYVNKGYRVRDVRTMHQLEAAVREEL